jgi:hypothetical protein
MDAFDAIRLVFAKTEYTADKLNLISVSNEIDLPSAGWSGEGGALQNTALRWPIPGSAAGGHFRVHERKMNVNVTSID